MLSTTLRHNALLLCSALVLTTSGCVFLDDFGDYKANGKIDAGVDASGGSDKDASKPAKCGDGVVDDGEECEPGESLCCKDDCSGPLKKDTVCRKAEDVCDQAETCDGEEMDCPADELAPDTKVCRKADGACDVDDFCSGERPDCPRDEFKNAGFECRATAGDCDVAEECDGEGPACPADKFMPDTKICRPAVDACDAEEACTGSSADCPTNLGACIPSVLGALPVYLAAIDTTTACDSITSSCATASSPDRVYSFTAPSAGLYRFSHYSNTKYTTLALFAGATCRGGELACSDDLNNSSGTLFRTLAAGETVLIGVEVNGGESATDLELGVEAFPQGWLCSPSFYGGGDGCDCGCGIQDPDCTTTLDTECQTYCLPCLSSSGSEICTDVVDDDENWKCAFKSGQSAPTDWTCDASYYADGMCDCGCTEPDPDCGTLDPANCIHCDACGDNEVPCVNSANIDMGNNAWCR